MAIGDFGAVLDSETFAQQAAQPPTLQKRTENVALLLTVDPAAAYPYLRSLDITDAGLIDATPIGTLRLPGVGGRDMYLAHFLEDVFAVYHNDAAANSKLWTVACDDQGVITDPPIDDLAVGRASNMARRSHIIKPHDNILLSAIAMPVVGSHLETITVTDAGFMPATVTDAMDLPNVPGAQTLRQGAGDRIVELDLQTTLFYIYSFTCSSAGALPAAVTDSWGPITSVASWGSLCKVSHTVFAVFVRDAAGDAEIHTFSINANGTINKSWLDSQQIEATVIGTPHMMEMGSGYFVLAYTMAAPTWRLRTCSIADDGTITLLDSKDLSSPNRGNPWFTHLNGDIWTLTYEDVAASVRVDTIEISTPAAAANQTHNELMVGLGP